MTQIAVFDVDNTLTESRTKIAPSGARLLSDLTHRMPVALISGQTFEDIQKQVISGLTTAHIENIYVLPTSGAELYSFRDGAWRKAYSFPMSEEKKRLILEKLAKVLGVAPLELGNYIYDRGCQITFSGMGKHAFLEEKYAWDPSREKRRALIQALRPHLSGISITIAGSTSVDFTEEGVDKAFGVSKLLAHMSIDPKDVVFVGDALDEGGNDAPVKTTGVRTIATTGPRNTESIIESLLSYPGAKKIAYFCMEYGLEDDIPLFSGGLGILAGDLVRAAGKRTDISLAAIGLINRKGMKSSENEGVIDYTPMLLSRGYEKVAEKEKIVLIQVPVEGRVIHACAWKKAYGTSTIYLLDTDVSNNTSDDRRITDFLYESEESTRAVQELLLGAGGVRLLARIGFSPDIFHINEGHAGLGALAVALEGHGVTSVLFSERLNTARTSIVATKHTILSGSGTYFSRETFERRIGPYIKDCGAHVDDVFSYGALDRDRNTFSTTKFLMAAAVRSTGVSAAHVEYEKIKYPQSKLFSITNGVDISHWAAPAFLAGVPVGSMELSRAKKALRKELVDSVNSACGSKLDSDTLTVVWARRFVEYKRPGLLTSDTDRLLALIDSPCPIQIVFAGRAYPDDEVGMKAFLVANGLADDPRFKGRIAYMPHYSIAVSKMLVRGADVWLNTPIPGYEACGTSGMKAGLSGSLVMSTRDGWVAEAHDIDHIGWILPEENILNSLYTSLGAAAAEFYEGSDSHGRGASERWLSRVSKTVALVRKDFDIQKMLDLYLEKLYK